MRFLLLFFLVMGCMAAEVAEEPAMPEQPEENLSEAPGEEPPVALPEEVRPHPDEIAELLFNYTNTQRIEHGLPALGHDAKLEKVANWQSRCLYENDIFEHDSEECGTLEERYVQFNINNAGGENLFFVEYEEAFSSEEAARLAFEEWMNSPDHRENIMEPSYTDLGIGVYIGEKVMITQNFMIDAACGWQDEPCCEEQEFYFCYVPWECGHDRRCS